MQALDCLAGYGDEATLGDAIIVFDVELPDSTHTNWRCTTGRAIVKLGLVEMARVGISDGGPIDDD